jgi:Integrase core domain
LEGISPSIGSIGDAYDNALAETVIGLYKTECIRTSVFHHRPYKTLAEVEYATAGWVDWYNNRRLHGSLGMIHRPNTNKPTTLPCSRRSSPHESGTKAVPVQRETRASAAQLGGRPRVPSGEYSHHRGRQQGGTMVASKGQGGSSDTPSLDPAPRWLA